MWRCFGSRSPLPLLRFGVIVCSGSLGTCMMHPRSTYYYCCIHVASALHTNNICDGGECTYLPCVFLCCFHCASVGTAILYYLTIYFEVYTLRVRPTVVLYSSSSTAYYDTGVLLLSVVVEIIYCFILFVVAAPPPLPSPVRLTTQQQHRLQFHSDCCMEYNSTTTTYEYDNNRTVNS